MPFSYPPPRSFVLCRFRVTHELEIRLFLHCSGKLLCIEVLLFHLRLVLFIGLSVDGHIGSLNLIAFIWFLRRLLFKFHFRRLNRFYRPGLCTSRLSSCSLYLVRYLLRHLHTRSSRRRLQVLDSSLCIGIGYNRSCRFLALSVAEPVTNVGTEITCTQTNTKGRKKPCKPVLSCSGKEARQSIGTEASSSTEQDVLEYLRINSRLFIQAHHLEVCLFVHVCLT